MTPFNTRVNTNHCEAVEGEFPYNLQQHLESSSFMPLRPTQPSMQLPYASVPQGGQPRPQLIALTQTRESRYKTSLKHKPEVNRPTESHIASSEQAPPPREAIVREMILTPTFIAALDKLLDRREHQVAACAFRSAVAFLVKEVTLRTQQIQLYAAPP